MRPTAHTANFTLVRELKSLLLGTVEMQCRRGILAHESMQNRAHTFTRFGDWFSPASLGARASCSREAWAVVVLMVMTSDRRKGLVNPVNVLLQDTRIDVA